MIDRYHYDLGGVQVGPRPGIIAFTPEWQGNHPPQHPITIASLKGCDVTPVDLTDPAQALRLKAYIWPEHTVRFDRLEAAIAARSEEHTTELQSLMRISYAVFCLKQKKRKKMS